MGHVFIYETSLGTIVLKEEADSIVGLEFARGRGIEAWEKEGWSYEETPLLAGAAAQIREYLEGRREYFELPLRTSGTGFQEKVWKALLQIPYGETRTYGELAAQVGSPKGARAVGMACNRNPIMVIIPCHRVIGRDGSLTGFGGGLDAKQGLLALEQGK